MNLLFFIALILICIYSSSKQKKEKFNQQVKEIEDFKVRCAKNGNRRLLDQFGEEKFVLVYGEDKLQSVKNNTDTKLVEPIEGWEERLRNGYGIIN